MGPIEVPKQSSLMLGSGKTFKSDSVALLPKAYMNPFALNLSLFPEGKYSSGYVNKNLSTNPATKLLTCNLSCLQNLPRLWWRRTWRGDQPISGLTLGSRQESEATLHCLDGHEPEAGYPSDPS